MTQDDMSALNGLQKQRMHGTAGRLRTEQYIAGVAPEPTVQRALQEIYVNATCHCSACRASYIGGVARRMFRRRVPQPAPVVRH